jgi:multidrug efflux pump subunit AcrA (membrane-fusion protein)
MGFRTGACLIALVTCGPGLAHGQGVRDHTRTSPRGTTVSESQAVDLTLTVTEAATRPVQTWVRTAGRIDAAGKIITAYLDEPDAGLVKAGQRARAFPVESRSSMYQARIARVVSEKGRTRVDVALLAPGRENVRSYVIEIVTERGEMLSVANEAIIEEGTARVVYIQREAGRYEPQVIRTGIQGELYTQVLDGLHEGDQVVTFGSFFIDSEFKLKGAAQATP